MAEARSTLSPPYCIDPDQFLDLSGAVPVGREDVRAAWDQAYALVTQRLTELGAEATFYLVFGLQGAGKSTWVAANSLRFPPRAVYLSGPLPSRKHRERALAIVRDAGCRCVGVWINEPFDVAFERNARRTGLARIKEEAMRHVEQNLEPPSLEEGFHEVIEVRSGT
ncbi:ATP-binding protein [Piscinibacter terrae]|uniref:Kinase n=1 Tax=Piscinibacter terrae TaxID=2496871 RepID=A0A3N7HU26_9BURK|nr:kinase [Albitalea terrae]RQP25810.1 kinase [Albitalea terrae]